MDRHADKYPQNPQYGVSRHEEEDTGGFSRHRWDDRKKVEKSSKPKAQRPIRGQEQELDDDYDEEAQEEREARRREKAERKAAKEREKQLALEQAREAAGPPRMVLPEFISVSNLGSALGVKQAQFLDALEELGFENIDSESIMTGETAALVAQEYGFEPSVEAGEGEDLKPRPTPEDKSLLPARPPVVTIMGHVDHGKTTLLDQLRQSSVAAQEHGGITQHIGAFSVKLSGGKQITFLDTPGHAAFLSMRQRGANVTDMVILVVAADDSVKPQTLEALRHARAAKVPIIVAINKIDKDKARPDQVKMDLAQHGVEIEEHGGDVQVVLVSGKTGQGMADLEENVVLLAEMLDLRAETDGMSEGWVLEASIKPIGRVATVLVKRGTLRRGDFIVAGKTWTKIRTLRNEAGLEVDEAAPGTPVEVLGWKDPPDAGDMVLQAPDEATAKTAARYREELEEREKDLAEWARADEERREKEAEEARAQEAEMAGQEVKEKEEQTGTKMVTLTVKADVHGSVEAVCAAIMEIGNNEVRPQILWSGPGQITPSDVEHSATAGAAIVNFSNPIPGHIKRMAEQAGVKLLDHDVIYHLVDAVKDLMSAYLKPNVIHRVVGEAEVLQVFRYNVKGRTFKKVAGCRVRNGYVSRTVKYRVVRNGERILEDAVLDSLKKVKQDVDTMRKGNECGMSFRDWEDFQVGDQIQAYEVVEEARRL